MDSDHTQPAPSHRSPWLSWRRLVSLACAAAVASVVGGALAQAAISTPAATVAESRALQASIKVSARLARQRLRPEAVGLAASLPGAVDRIGSLREPARTTEAQLSEALGQLAQMNALTYFDPHYLPALIAVGRAYLAASGSAPLTGVRVDPEYTGLGPELATDRVALKRSARRAAKLSVDVKRLGKELAGQKRLAQRLSHHVEHLRDRGTRPRG